MSNKIEILSEETINSKLSSLDSWSVTSSSEENNHHLVKEFSFSNFVTALDFVNKVGEVAEIHNHHPNINFTWGRVTLNIWTHDIGGISEKDFALASEIDTIK